MRVAGELGIPYTSGILIGIGETRAERIESLLALRDLNDAYGHIQEIIIQNFRAKEGTTMASSPEPELDDLLWTIASARVVFGPGMAGAFRGSMQHEPDEEVSWCDDVARAWRWLRRRNCGAGGDTGNR